MLIRPNRRQFLNAAATLPLAAMARPVWAGPEALVIGSRQIEVMGKAVTVYGFTGPDGKSGIYRHAGDRFAQAVRNDTDAGVVTHWHGQVLAAEGQDRAYTGGGELAAGAVDQPNFELTPGTHWMHSHQLTEQQLMAAPMVCREADAEDIQEHVVMLHDFTFKSPEEILAGLAVSMAHGHGAASGADAGGGMSGMDMGGMDMSGDMSGMKMDGMPTGGMAMGGMSMNGGAMMVHANDVVYDAYLANDRTLADPEVVQVEAGARVRLRIINGGTATAFWIDPGVLASAVIAVDGGACSPMSARTYPMAQGQRLDIVVTIPAEGGAFPIFAQVEAAKMRTGIVLATSGAVVPKFADQADADAGYMGTEFDAGLVAVNALPERAARVEHFMLGEEPGYKFTINGKMHGEAEPVQAKVGERLELMFMNMGMMMHPMHLHGHHFQVVDLGNGRFNGPRRDVVAVPPGAMVTVAVDLDKKGSWFLHCHHLYHMATGMMTEVLVS